MKTQGWAILAGAAMGAGAMYLLDPRGGARRRALIRDQVVHATHKTGDALDALAHDVANRAKGVVAETSSVFRRQSISARQLQERVRAELGRLVSHPRAIDVHATDDGCITLSGPVLASEAESLMTGIHKVRGVCSIEDRLERHATTEGVPALQGGRLRPGQAGVLAGSWSPTTTGAAVLSGTALALGLSYKLMNPKHVRA